MKQKLCKGTKNLFITKVPDRLYEGYSFYNFHISGLKRFRLKCPRCGRKLISDIIVDHDGRDVFHSIPDHKPKHWWKRKSLRRTKGK